MTIQWNQTKSNCKQARNLSKTELQMLSAMQLNSHIHPGENKDLIKLNFLAVKIFDINSTDKSS